MSEAYSPARSPALAAELIRSRRTIHTFAPETPPLEVIQRAVEVARWAPNHRLTEPWRFYLLGRESVERVCRLNAEIVSRVSGYAAGESKYRRWRVIPGWLAVTCAVTDHPIRHREDYAACCCAMQNLMLYLWSAGIGSKWTTGAVTRDPAFFPILGADPGKECVVGLLWYGYPAESGSGQRKPVAQVLTELP
ncbi:MAG: nitroreductase family protein [Gammaproteobacteria bacterium]